MATTNYDGSTSIPSLLSKFEMNLLNRIALLVPDGVGVRNFLLGGFLQALPPQTELHIFHAIPERLRESGDNLHWYDFAPNTRSSFTLVLQQALQYAQMYWADTVAMRRHLACPVRGSRRHRLFIHGTRLLGRAMASPRRMRVLEWLHGSLAAKQLAIDYYHGLFERIRPEVLFCTSQRPSLVVAPVVAARMLGIPTATFIFSWDNITSKGRILAPFEYYLVWSDHMRQELLRYYPAVPPENIYVVGTPQFEPYSQGDLLWPRQEFFARIGADPARPLICYSGGDLGTCPEDQEHVRILMELVRDRAIQHNPQVLVRPAPVDSGLRYEPVRRAFPEMIFSQPQWTHMDSGDWSRVMPSKADIQFLANLTHHASLNVNLGSTMTLDFAVHDKPVVNIAFDVADPPIFGMPVWDFYYNYEHYRPVVQLGAARFARSREELRNHINAYLSNPSLDREARRRLADLEIGVPLDQSSQLIIETLQAIGGRESARPSMAGPVRAA